MRGMQRQKERKWEREIKYVIEAETERKEIGERERYSTGRKSKVGRKIH